MSSTNREKAKRAKDESVFSLIRNSRCYNCDQAQPPGSIVKLKRAEDEREVLCRKCAGLDEYVCVPAGNANITRLAKKYSATRYVLLRWSELWKCYERQGLLVEQGAVTKIEHELGIDLSQNETHG